MFGIDVLEDIVEGDVRIVKENDSIVFSMYDSFFLHDDIDYIDLYCYELKNKDYGSVLIGGLGLGIMPYYIENNKSGVDIDVVEIRNDVISATGQLGHISCSIVNDDFTSHQTTKKYDIIVADLWWLTDENFENEKQTILQNYANNLNEGGFVYFPITKEMIWQE